jgi:predicted CXXCH cytochrome family protein
MMNLQRSLVLAGVVLFTLVAWSQDTGKTGKKHNLNGQNCATCHVLLGASPSPPAHSSACDTTALWDCELLSRIFQSYDAALAGGKGAGGDDTQVRMSSMLCASCHDGVSTADMNRGSKADFLSNVGGSLQNEHPIDVPLDPTKNPNLAAVPVVLRQVKLFGRSHRVQCTTCHEVHDNKDADLLRTPNKNSSLCVICHL